MWRLKSVCSRIYYCGLRKLLRILFFIIQGPLYFMLAWYTCRTYFVMTIRQLNFYLFIHTLSSFNVSFWRSEDSAHLSTIECPFKLEPPFSVTAEYINHFLLIIILFIIALHTLKDGIRYSYWVHIKLSHSAELTCVNSYTFQSLGRTCYNYYHLVGNFS